MNGLDTLLATFFVWVHNIYRAAQEFGRLKTNLRMRPKQTQGFLKPKAISTKRTFLRLFFFSWRPKALVLKEKCLDLFFLRSKAMVLPAWSMSRSWTYIVTYNDYCKSHICHDFWSVENVKLFVPIMHK